VANGLLEARVREVAADESWVRAIAIAVAERSAHSDVADAGAAALSHQRRREDTESRRREAASDSVPAARRDRADRAVLDAHVLGAAARRREGGAVAAAWIGAAVRSEHTLLAERHARRSRASAQAGAGIAEKSGTALSVRVAAGQACGGD